jgi:hypothetical protein
MGIEPRPIRQIQGIGNARARTETGRLRLVTVSFVHVGYVMLDIVGPSFTEASLEKERTALPAAGQRR